jgi:hypothetical protein
MGDFFFQPCSHPVRAIRDRKMRFHQEKPKRSNKRRFSNHCDIDRVMDLQYSSLVSEMEGEMDRVH